MFIIRKVGSEPQRWSECPICRENQKRSAPEHDFVGPGGQNRCVPPGYYTVEAV